MPAQSNLTREASDRTQQVGREVRVQVNTRTRPRFELSGPKVIAGALAAASAAVAASWLGVAGTVIGAVVASLVASVTTALYSHPLEKKPQVIRETLPVFPMQRPEGSLDRPTVVGSDGTEVLPITSDVPPHEIVRVASASPRRLQWGPVLLSALVTLIIGVGILTGAEALLGRPVSSIFGGTDGGGTTVGHLVHHGGSSSTEPGSDNGGGTGTKPEPSVPTDTQPTEPTPTEPTPTEPTPTEPTPTEPTPTNPTPEQPTSTGADGTPASGAATGGAPAN